MLEVLPHTTLQFYLVDYTYRRSISPQNRSVLHGSENFTEASNVKSFGTGCNMTARLSGLHLTDQI